MHLPEIPKDLLDWSAPRHRHMFRCDGTIERMGRNEETGEVVEWTAQRILASHVIRNDAGAFGHLHVMLFYREDETAEINKSLNCKGDACLCAVFDNAFGGDPPPDALYSVSGSYAAPIPDWVRADGNDDAWELGLAVPPELQNRVCKELILLKHVISNPWTECLRLAMKLATRQAMTLLPIGQWIAFNEKMQLAFLDDFEHPHAQTFHLDDMELAFNEDVAHPHAQKFHVKGLPPSIGESVVVLRSKNALESALQFMFIFMHDVFTKTVSARFFMEVNELRETMERRCCHFDDPCMGMGADVAQMARALYNKGPVFTFKFNRMEDLSAEKKRMHTGLKKMMEENGCLKKMMEENGYVSSEEESEDDPSENHSNTDIGLCDLRAIEKAVIVNKARKRLRQACLARVLQRHWRGRKGRAKGANRRELLRRHEEFMWESGRPEREKEQARRRTAEAERERIKAQWPRALASDLTPRPQHGKKVGTDRSAALKRNETAAALHTEWISEEARLARLVEQLQLQVRNASTAAEKKAALKQIKQRNREIQDGRAQAARQASKPERFIRLVAFLEPRFVKPVVPLSSVEAWALPKSTPSPNDDDGASVITVATTSVPLPMPTKHAVQRGQERNVDRRAVQSTLKHGAVKAQPGGRLVHLGAPGGVDVVTNVDATVAITVMPARATGAKVGRFQK